MVKRDSYFELQHNRTVKVLFLLLFGAVIAGLFFIFRYYVWPFLFAVLLYVALRPVYDFMAKYIKRRGLASGLMILILIVAIMVPLFFVVAALADQIYHLVKIVQKQIESGVIEDVYYSPFIQWIDEYLDIDPATIAARITNFVQNISGMILSSIQTIIAYPFRFMVNFFFLLLMLFFLFKDGHNLESMFYRALPFPEDIEKQVIDRLKEVVRVLLIGNIVIMIFQGLMVGLGLVVTGIRLAFLGGSVAAILSLIPVIGTSLVWIPAVIYLVFTGSYLKALFLGVWCLAWYLLLENLVKPKVFGRKLRFHPVVFFFLLLGGIQAFGLPGVFIGPLLLTLCYSLWEIYRMLQAYDINQSSDGQTDGGPGETVSAD
ncbi:MAG: hypothetical protein A2176_09775 [Spirochaetes bacterium RBG_13_51_14]|nr:MAG: hypothetical protein A2176_09775 [Spirochaetes bacterium RBG_13_51_14]